MTDNTIQIVDFGHSEYRSGLSGDDNYHVKKSPTNFSNLDEFLAFIENN